MTQPRGAPAVVALLLFLVSPAAPAGSGDEPRGETREYMLTVDGAERWTSVYRPPGYRAGGPVVVLLHGGTQSMRKMFSRRAGGAVEWLLLADRENFLFLVPNGTHADTGDPKGDKQNWNDLRPDAAEGQTPADDVGFLLRLLDWARSQYAYDPARVYLTGASNGGMMTMRMVLEAPQRFTAAAALIGSLPQPPPAQPAPGTRIPLLFMNGTRDPLVRWEGGPIRGTRGDMLPVPAMVQWWRALNGVDRVPGEAETLPDGDPDDGCRIRRTTWPGRGKGSATVVFYEVDGGGHNAPSIKFTLAGNPLLRYVVGPQCHDASAVELVWEFFKKSSARTDR